MTAADDTALSTPIPSPNIWNDPDTYEIENHAVDRAERIEAAMLAHRGLVGARVLDLGCGSGFHLERWVHYGATSVVGCEPHTPLAERANARVTGLDPAVRERISVIEAGAEAIPVADRSIDVMQARWAYFFGSGCEPGLAELDRVMAPGGVAFVVDDDLTVPSTFGSWFRAAYPAYDEAATERFWRRAGWARQTVAITWELDRREDLAAVVRIEFPAAAAERILAEHGALTVDYSVALRTRRF